MKLINSTVDFVIHGLPHPDIPILVNRDMVVVEPVLRFIVHSCIDRGGVSSPKTVRSYANALYDYFSFLEANDLDWKPSEAASVSAIALYRNWSSSLTGNAALKPSTINTRLSVLQRFYEYCRSVGMIDSLPWVITSKQVRASSEGFMRHTHTGQRVDSTGLRLKTFAAPPKLLSLDQCKALLRVIDNKTLLLMVKLAVSTGMRRDEIVSFQRKTVFLPSADIMNQRLAVDLVPEPGGQRTKGNRARTVYIPAPLMAELHEFTRWGEGVKRAKAAIAENGCAPGHLFISSHGGEYSESSLNTLLNKLQAAKKIDFHVTPHMLRHTFATIELYAESQTKDMAQALCWVRDRLGHSSIQTTMVYLHCIEQLESKEMHQYQIELMELASE